MSKRRIPTPTWILVLILWMSPGKVNGTDTIIAVAARQFCGRLSRISKATEYEEGLLLRMYTYTFHEADTLRERRHTCGVRANTKGPC